MYDYANANPEELEEDIRPRLLQEQSQEYNRVLQKADKGLRRQGS